MKIFRFFFINSLLKRFIFFKTKINIHDGTKAHKFGMHTLHENYLIENIAVLRKHLLTLK